MEMFFNRNLRNIAIIKLATNYFKSFEIRESLKKCLIIEQADGVLKLKLRQDFTNVILRKVTHSPLPAPLKAKLRDTVIFMAKELTCWLYQTMEDRCEAIKKCASHLLDSLEWSPEGRVDVTRTVRKVIHDPKVDSYHKIILSCKFFFEAEAELLWDKLSDKWKLEFEALSLLDNFFQPRFPIYNFWYSYLNTKQPPPIEDYVQLIVEVIRTNNILALKYLWEKLGPQYREAFIDQMHCSVLISSADVLQFFLSQGLIIQTEILQMEPGVLLCLALNNWLWNNSFDSLLMSCDQYLARRHTTQLLEHFVTIIEEYPSSNELRNSVRIFWSQCSTRVRLNWFDSHQVYFRGICLLNDKNALNLFFSVKEFDFRAALFKKDLPRVLKLHNKEERYEVLCHVWNLVYRTEEEIDVFKTDLITVNQNSMLKTFVNLGDLKLVKFLKEMASPSEILWDEVKIMILRPELLMLFLEKFGAAVFIEFLDYLYVSPSGPDERFLAEKKSFVVIHSETILCHLFENNLTRNWDLEKSFINSFLPRAYLLSVLESLFTTRRDFFDAGKRKEIYKVCSLTVNEELDLERELFMAQWERELQSN